MTDTAKKWVEELGGEVAYVVSPSSAHTAFMASAKKLYSQAAECVCSCMFRCVYVVDVSVMRVECVQARVIASQTAADKLEKAATLTSTITQTTLAPLPCLCVYVRLTALSGGREDGLCVQ